MKRFIASTALCLFVAAIGTVQTHATGVDANLSLSAHVNLTVNEIGCQNSPGPTVTLEGHIVLGAVCAKVLFSNNAKGTHTASVVQEAQVVLSLGQKITIPKQPVLGGVGGNPHIYLQFTDGDGNPVSEEVLLGRCVQGLNVSGDVLEEALAHLDVGATGCSNKGGPFITLGGVLTLSGLHAKLIFRNNVKGTHTAEATADVSLIVEGQQIVLPKQPVRGGVGGNPLISVGFIDCESGEAITDPVLLGRCVQLN